MKNNWKEIEQEFWERIPDDITTQDLFYRTQIMPHFISALEKAYERGRREENIRKTPYQNNPSTP